MEFAAKIRAEQNKNIIARKIKTGFIFILSFTFPFYVVL
jgi:hypothetical protein